LRGPADAVQQIRHPARGVGHPEQPPDQDRDPVQGPTLIDPAMRGGATVELGDQPGELGSSSMLTAPPASREANAVRPPLLKARRHARTDFGITHSRAAISVEARSCSNRSAACPRNRSRAALSERSAHHHRRISWVRRRPRPALDHAGTPGVINKPNPGTSVL
jgi:hypothetical protein